MIENPPGFVVSTEAQKAASNNGFRVPLGVDGGWLHYASTTAKGEIWIGGVGPHGPWFLAVGDPTVARELHLTASGQTAGPGAVRLEFASLGDLHEAVGRVYRLALSLPDAPLEAFEARTRGLPRSTEAERLVIQRVGQDLFRDALMNYWNGRCPLTGITEPALLRASHIVPWSVCTTDAQRLDVHNGLLLSSLWDAAFDAGLVTFDDNGRVVASAKLGSSAKEALHLDGSNALPGLGNQHRANLLWHRHRHGYIEAPSPLNDSEASNDFAGE